MFCCSVNICCLSAVQSSEFKFPSGIQGISQPVSTVTIQTWILPAKTYLVYPPLHAHLNCKSPLNPFFQTSFISTSDPQPPFSHLLGTVCFGTCCLALLNDVCVQLVFPTTCECLFFPPQQLAQCSTWDEFSGNHC